jgi:hypothetical protein
VAVALLHQSPRLHERQRQRTKRDATGKRGSTGWGERDNARHQLGKTTRHVLEAEEKSGESGMRRIDALLTLPEPLPPSKLKPPAFPLHSLAQLLNFEWRRHAHTTQMLHRTNHVTSCVA